jgi:hypothetical protein
VQKQVAFESIAVELDAEDHLPLGLVLAAEDLSHTIYEN